MTNLEAYVWFQSRNPGFDVRFGHLLGGFGGSVNPTSRTFFVRKDGSVVLSRTAPLGSSTWDIYRGIDAEINAVTRQGELHLDPGRIDDMLPRDIRGAGWHCMEAKAVPGQQGASRYQVQLRRTPPSSKSNDGPRPMIVTPQRDGLTLIEALQDAIDDTRSLG